MVNQQLLLQNEYLLAENRILRAHLPSRLLLTNPKQLIVRMACENSGWGYDRIAGALQTLGHHVSDQTVGNILRRFGIPPALKRRQMSWADFIRSHMAVLAGIDFFTVEVLTWRGLTTYYVLFFLHLETRDIILAGITRHPTEECRCNEHDPKRASSLVSKGQHHRTSSIHQRHIRSRRLTR